MNRTQYESLFTAPQERTHVFVADLVDWTERTLLYGYTSARESFHVYLSGGLITVHVYTGTELNPQTVARETHESWPAYVLFPDKRVYPESTDIAFLKLLHERGVRPDLARFDDTRRERVAHLTFHGAL